MTTLKRKTASGYENLGLGGIPRPASALNGKPLKWDDTNSVVADATADLNAAYVTVVSHGATAGTTRPSGATVVRWIGSVAPTNGVAGDVWRDTTLNADRVKVGSYWYYPPGLELGYQELTTSDTTTNTNGAAVASNLIAGLAITVTGTGQPVDHEFYCPGVYHSVASTGVGVKLIINGSLTTGQQAMAQSTQTASGRTLVMRRRLVLTAGTSYTLEVGKFVNAAGTGTYACSSDLPMYASATCR